MCQAPFWALRSATPLVFTAPSDGSTASRFTNKICLVHFKWDVCPESLCDLLKDKQLRDSKAEI